MVFKRRDKRSWGRAAIEALWPRGGWNRAAMYMKHRLRRLPDAPHRIARGIFAGILVSFSPLFGLHFGGAALIAWIMRGNILAALMATFVGNPITFPFIAAFSVEFGNFLLGHPGVMSPLEIFRDFGQASAELTRNISSLFSSEPAHWDRLSRFFFRVYWPYLVGGIIPGLIAGTVGYYVSLPIILAYQNRRTKKLRERIAKRIAAREAEAAGQGMSSPVKSGVSKEKRAKSGDDAAVTKA
ncbi:DUF2062 domain-containing protein [Pseudorhodobacter sp.]|uniref:DUF2062 domain-containing protein n=1 Tax=Pseudorhodobacter sp. TaxID=1934400 RepID=UPI00264701D6|nr:DUF2062 domain-containing protein [Pseudorhodobacter sp.]MDN5787224.1 DUF2062 domain-containing protein [Pseudorhodobacter sp.]